MKRFLKIINVIIISDIFKNNYDNQDLELYKYYCKNLEIELRKNLKNKEINVLLSNIDKKAKKFISYRNFTICLRDSEKFNKVLSNMSANILILENNEMILTYQYISKDFINGYYDIKESEVLSHVWLKERKRKFSKNVFDNITKSPEILSDFIYDNMNNINIMNKSDFLKILYDITYEYDYLKEKEKL